MAGEIRIFIKSFWYGIQLMICYDCLRILRKVWRHKERTVAWEDIVFGTGSGIFLFIHYYQDNNGILRIYLLTGVVLGILVWNRSLGPYFVKYLSRFLLKCRFVLGIPKRKLQNYGKRLKFWIARRIINEGIRKRARKREMDRGAEYGEEKKHQKKERAVKKSQRAD